MKKLSALTSIFFYSACGVQDTETSTSSIDTVTVNSVPSQAPPVSQGQSAATPVPDTPAAANNKTLSNKRFRNVKVQKLANDSFLITGQGQIFEASFNWIIEDGHEELQHNYSTTDAGAPEWGNFSFKVHAAKKRPNSTLHLVLFETSAKDGSRQYELPLLLH